ncbi:uncharacterized protein LOC143064575 isoform X1 [Mytilus galloprovincialis]|uniref:uncharacterized protein LOC143064575 isoform X1 n=1 Tax=Mytilus galloprovincialis TaxID=29158 RepID=UPI003F7B53CB
MTDPKKPALPHGWVVKQSSSYPDRVYFFNVNTGNSTWHLPSVEIAAYQSNKVPEKRTKSCLSKPGVSRQQTPKSVSIAPQPEFSPEADSHETSDDDLLDLTDEDGKAESEGHKHHMEILHGSESPVRTNIPHKNFIPQRQSGSGQLYAKPYSFDDQLASMQDVDMRKGLLPHPIYQRPLPSHSSQTNYQQRSVPKIENTHKHSLLTASTVSASDSRNYHEQTIVNEPLWTDVDADRIKSSSNRSLYPLRLPITPDKSCSFVPHTPSEQPSLSERDLSSSFQTLPSVHSSILPGYHQYSSTPIDKRNNVQNKANSSYPESNKLFQSNMDTDLRIERTIKNDIENKSVFKQNTANEERKRRLSDLWTSQKDVKKVKCNISSNNKEEYLCNVKSDTYEVNDLIQRPKVLSANDLRHKVLKKHENQNNNMPQDLRNKVLSKKGAQSFFQQETDLKHIKLESDNCGTDSNKPFIPKKKICELETEAGKSDIRKVVSNAESTGCNFSDLRSEDVFERDQSPKDSEEPNKTDVHIDHDKLLSIQTWIDNLQPNASFCADEEESSSKRTSPDSGVLSITYSNDLDNRRIVVEKGTQPMKTVDSGISSVSNNTVFQPIVEPSRSSQNYPNTCWKGVHAQGIAIDHTRDIMDMEIDDIQNNLTEEDNRPVEDMEVTDIVVKEVRATLKNRSTEVVGMLTEMISEDTNVTSKYQSHRGLFIVIDTNVLIGNLSFIEDLRDRNILGHGRPVLVFPWVVMQELDYLKTGKTTSASLSLSTAKKARDAVTYLYQCLQASHPRIVGQTPAQARMTCDVIKPECNDDRIIKCCVQFQNDHPDCIVILLTNDRNLCNKSVITGIKAFPQQSLLSVLPTLEGVVNPQRPIADEQNSKPDSNVQKKETHIEMQTSNNVESEAQYLDDVYCEVKSLIQEALSTILEREMKKLFDDIWLNIVYRKPPWSYRDVLECFKKHWIAVFGQIYNRTLIKCVENLLGLIVKGDMIKWSIVEEMICDSIPLLDEDLKHESCNSSISKIKSDLLDLKGCCRGPKKANINQKCQPAERHQKTTSPFKPQNQQTSKMRHQPIQSSQNNDRNKQSHSGQGNKQSNSGHGNRQSHSGQGNQLSHTGQINRQSHSGQGNRQTNSGQRIQQSHSGQGNKLSQSSQGNTQGHSGQGIQPSQFSQGNKKSQSSQGNKQRKRRKSGNTKSTTQQQPFSKSEIKLQQIWQTILKASIELKEIAVSTDSPQRRVYDMCDTLVPVVKDLEYYYSKALMIPPGDIRSHIENIIELCDHLNSFHDSVEIEDTEGPIETFDLLDLFAADDKRSVLENGHKQLKDFMQEIASCIEQLPD